MHESLKEGIKRKENQMIKRSCDSSMALAPRTENGNGIGFFFNELDRILDFSGPSVSSHGWHPISAHETETGYRYDLELPGLKKDGLKVTLTDGVLAVKGRKRLFRDGSETTVDIDRSVVVPEDVDPEKVRARYADGILTLELSKREEAKPKTIQVAVE